MKKYKEAGTCDICFFGRELCYKKEDAKCSWHEGKHIEPGQKKCNQFLRSDFAKKK
jgi:hypothetical protein